VGRDRAEADSSRPRTPQASGAQGSGRGHGALGWESPPLVGPDQPACCLMAAMDDATGKLLRPVFPFEGSSGYLCFFESGQALWIPLVMYHDRHGALHRNDRIGAWRSSWPVVRSRLRWAWRWSLGIESIAALSPKPKGELKGSLGPCRTASSLNWASRESGP